MRSGAILVNVGRGGVVDEEALAQALGDGRLAGAVLDVFSTEPLPQESPLWRLPNVLISPHTAALSVRENERIVPCSPRICGVICAGDISSAAFAPRCSTDDTQ